jgi:hypothetical protein
MWVTSDASISPSRHKRLTIGCGNFSPRTTACSASLSVITFLLLRPARLGGLAGVLLALFGSPVPGRSFSATLTHFCEVFPKLFPRHKRTVAYAYPLSAWPVLFAWEL